MATNMRANRVAPAAWRRGIRWLFVLGALVVSGCGDSASPAQTAAASKDSHEVNMKLIAYSPAMIEVRQGAQVKWNQMDPGVHTVTSGTVHQAPGGSHAMADGKFESGEIPQGSSFAVTFAEPGTYSYFCAIHPSTMTGNVRVDS